MGGAGAGNLPGRALDLGVGVLVAGGHVDRDPPQLACLSARKHLGLAPTQPIRDRQLARVKTPDRSGRGSSREVKKETMSRMHGTCSSAFENGG
eukprot:2810694-Alexandrium_andersonii.AAC.1